MTEPSLGRLTRVALRDYWKREDTDFTPWLAREENIAHLGEKLGLDLKVEATEERIGPFRADILCSAVNRDGPVLIENQLETTDHKHLGQLITYAAGLDGAFLVWIAASFSDEHLAALDWLNDLGQDRVQCFGVQIELLAIGESEPAPNFTVLSKPKGWQSGRVPGSRRASAQASERADRNNEVWTLLKQRLDAHDGPLDLDNANRLHWVRIKNDAPGLNLVVSYGVKNQLAKVWFMFRGDDAIPLGNYACENRQVLDALTEDEFAWPEDDTPPRWAWASTDVTGMEDEAIIDWYVAVADQVRQAFLEWVDGFAKA